MTVKKLAALLILLLCTACANQKLPASEEQMEKPKETFAYIENEDANNRFPRLSARDLVQVGQYLFGTGVFGQNLILQCYDLSCKTAEVACSKPDCTHDNEECNAYYYRDCGSLSLYHDQLYWLGVEGEGAEKMDTLAIRRMDPFAGTRESVRSVDWNRTMKEYWPQRMRIHKGTAYFECWRQIIVENAEPKHKLSLLAMPLSEKGETKVLFEQEYDCWAEMQVRYCGNDIYLFCSLWTDTMNAYEVCKINTITLEREQLVPRTEVDCAIEDFWVVEDGRILAAGKEKAHLEKAKVWQVKDSTLIELFTFEEENEPTVFLFDHIAVNIGHDGTERPCCIRDFDGNVLFDGKLTLPTQIPDLHLQNCESWGIYIMGGDRDRLFVSYDVSDKKNVNIVVTMMYEIKNHMNYSIIWTENRDGTVS